MIKIKTENLRTEELHKLMSGVVIPRPIALVSTTSLSGVHNAAPFSYFNMVSNDPSIIMFSIEEQINGGKKDTLLNIEQTSEFVVNLVNEKIAQKMHNSAAEFVREVSEFSEVGFTPVLATTVSCVAVKESPVHLECILERIIPIGEGSRYIVLGLVKAINIDDSILIDSYKINIKAFNPVARLAGNYYGTVGEIFSLDREYDEAKVKRSSK